MNLAYARKTSIKKDQIIKNIEKVAPSYNMEIQSKMDLSNGTGYLLNVINKEWISKVVIADPNVVGILPGNILILEVNDETLVATGEPHLLSGVSSNPIIHHLVHDIEGKVREFINEIAEVEELKVAKVKLYSTHTCPYCKLEKEWLDDVKVEHDVVYLEEDQEEAKRVVENTGQMGVPVTEIQYEDGESEFIVGFDKRALTEKLNLA